MPQLKLNYCVIIQAAHDKVATEGDDDTITAQEKGAEK